MQLLNGMVLGSALSVAASFAVAGWLLGPPPPENRSRVVDLTWRSYEAERRAEYLAEELKLRTAERDAWRRLAVPRPAFAEDAGPADLGPDDLIPPQDLPIPVKGRP